MRLDPYRHVLALPGVRSLMVLALLARIPITAIGVTMTLHVAQDLHRGWGAAGLVGAALTVGTAIGGPLNGRFVDRKGLRPMLIVTTACEALFWAVAPSLSYPALLVGALVAGVFSLPVFSVVRQSLAALVPADQRRQAYALDSMSVELSFMTGPPLAVLLMSSLSGRVTMWAIGGCLVLAGVALFATNPPVHAPADPAEPAADAAPLRRRDWLTPRFLAVCAAASATTMVLAGTDLGIVAMLREAGKVHLIGALLAAWGIYSLIGGFVYGALTRTVPLVALIGGLSLLTLPIGLVGDRWWLLFIALLPAGALCAPTLSASADLISRLVPSPARGEAMGWHGSSLTVGLAIGSPLAGWAIDHGSPSWGFAAVGAVGVLITAVLLVLRRGSTPLDPTPTTAKATAATSSTPPTEATTASTPLAVATASSTAPPAAASSTTPTAATTSAAAPSAATASAAATSAATASASTSAATHSEGSSAAPAAAASSTTPTAATASAAAPSAATHPEAPSTAASRSAAPAVAAP